MADELSEEIARYKCRRESYNEANMCKTLCFLFLGSEPLILLCIQRGIKVFLVQLLIPRLCVTTKNRLHCVPKGILYSVRSRKVERRS
jgi:hypothetical protein